MDKKRQSIIKKYISKQQIAKHSLNSYNYFVEKGVKDFFKQQENHVLFEIVENQQKIKYVLKFSSPQFTAPEVKEFNSGITQLTHIDSLLRNLSYICKLLVNISLQRQNVDTGTVEIISRKSVYELCEFPIMIGSVLDPHKLQNWDIGGYFIVKGAERIILCLEEIGKNFIFHTKDESTETVNIYSSTAGYRFLNKVLITKPKITLTFQPVNTKLNALAVIKYLGYNDKQIIDEIAKKDIELELILLSYLEAEELNSEQSCKDYLIKSLSLDGENDEIKFTRIDYVLDKYLFIHLGESVISRKFKAKLLVEMVREALLIHLGKLQPKMLDSYEYKRIKLPGYLLEELFKVYFNKLIYNFKQQLMKAPNRAKVKILTLLKTEILTNAMLNAISTGNWVGGRQKITTILDRTNILSAISSLRRIISPLVKTQQHIEARIIDPTHRGRIDPIDTPHGLNCGLVKSLSFGAKISEYINELELQNELKNRLQKVKPGNGALCINEKIVLTDLQPDQLYKTIKQLRSNNNISQDISLDLKNFDKGIINLNIEAGRVLKPLLVVYKNKLILDKFTEEEIELMDQNTLVQKNIIEYLDVAEEKSCSISYTNEIKETTTHVEIHPSFLFNYMANTIPFISNNSASRASLGQKLLRQATTNYIPLKDVRPYARNFSTSYLQDPLITTTVGKELLNKMQHAKLGINLVVAVMPLEGFNMEDAIIVKKESIERGLLFTEFKKSVSVQSLSSSDEEVKKFKVPDKSTADLREMKYYSTLDIDGLTRQNLEIENNHAIVGKVNLPAFRQTYSIESTNYTDATIFEKTNNTTYVNSVIVSKTKQGVNIANIILREPKFLNVGDKLSSRYGQKGVIGAIKSEKDLPFSQSGIVPDILISPHGFPSRLTFGHTLEMLYSKIAAITGKRICIDYLQETPINKQALQSIGLKHNGNEIFYNPDTGKPMLIEIYTGISYYLRLQHIVDHKIYARAKGPVQILTRQPTEGKQKEGGLRLGEMQRDALIAYGAANLTKERLNVDLVFQILCTSCNLFVEENHKADTICKICKTAANLTKVKIPYAFKLLVDELNACNIKMQFKTNDVL